MKQQAGFTLIELVMVIVIIGVLSAVALPKFINLQGDAQEAALEGVAGALSSASAVNYAARKVGSVSALAATVAVDNCSDIASALQGGALPTGFSITAAAVAADAVKTDCTLTGPGAQTTTFTAHGI